MFPIRSTWIFRSRWMAFLWAAGILWFALDVAGSSEPPPDNGTSADATAP